MAFGKKQGKAPANPESMIDAIKLAAVIPSEQEMMIK